MGNTPVNPNQNPPPPPVDLSQDPAATIQVTATGLANDQSYVIEDVAQSSVDPRKRAQLTSLGYQDTGWLINQLQGFVLWLHRNAVTIGAIVAPLFDSFLGVISGLYEGFQGEHSGLFWQLCAFLMTDLTGVEVDPNAMSGAFAQRGRIAAMQKLGGSLLDLLASEFVGVTQTERGGTFTVGPANTSTGLPDATLSPAQGYNAAKTFMGFASSFALRAGNSEALGDLAIIGEFGGAYFKEITENFAQAFGLGRLGRIALKPLIQTMVATPLTWALNQQYRPKLLDALEAVKALRVGAFSDEAFAQELAWQGYSDARQQALIRSYTRPLSFMDYRIGLAAGLIDVPGMAARLAVDNYDLPTVEAWNQVADLELQRRLSVSYINHYLTSFYEGHLTSDSINTLMQQIQSNPRAFLLTPGEIAGLQAFVDGIAQNQGAVPARQMRPRHLWLLQYQKAFVDGTITIDQYVAHLQALGYSPDDISILEIEALLAANKAEQAAAKQAAKAGTASTLPTSGIPGITGPL